MRIERPYRTTKDRTISILAAFLALGAVVSTPITLVKLYKNYAGNAGEQVQKPLPIKASFITPGYKLA